MTGRTEHTDLELDYIAEESRNLGTIVVTFWPRTPSPMPEPYTVLSVSSDAVRIGTPSGSSSLSLPSRVFPQSTTISAVSAHLHELRLSTVPPSPTHARPDLEVLAPLSTAELRSALPAVFACGSCDAQLVDAREVTRYNALPSEHWAELLDAWMCHQDQTLNEDLVAKGKGVKPRDGEALVGAAYVLFGTDATMGWTTPAGAEVSPACQVFSHPYHRTSGPTRKSAPSFDPGPAELAGRPREPRGRGFLRTLPKGAVLIQGSNIESLPVAKQPLDSRSTSRRLQATAHTPSPPCISHSSQSHANATIQSTRTETDDSLLPAHCTTCAAVIGSHVVPLDRSQPSFLRLLKYATYATASTTGSPLLRYSLSLHLTSALLELGQAHACHRFVLVDAEDDRPRLLVRAAPPLTL